jgi:uncharacterized protein YuzE
VKRNPAQASGRTPDFAGAQSALRSLGEPCHDGEMKTMRMRVDHAADAVYLNLTDRPIKDSEEVADGIVVDYDEEGRIVGIEILDASKRTEDPTALKQFSFEEA